MGRRPGRGDRYGGAGAGGVHADEGLSARLRSFRGKAEAGFPGRLGKIRMERFAHYEWPFLEQRHAALAREADKWADENLAPAHGANPDAIVTGLVPDPALPGALHH